MFSPLQVDIQPSRLCFRVTLGLHAAALLAIWLSGFETFTQWVFTLLLALIWAYILPRYLRLSHVLSVTGVRWLADRKSLSVCCSNGQWYPVAAQRETLVWPFLVAFSVRVQGRYLPLTVLVFCDSVAEDQFRRLKVLARFAVPIGSVSTSTHN